MARGVDAVEQQSRSSIHFQRAVEPQPAPGSADLGIRVRSAIRRVQDFLLAAQAEDGHWCAELEGDSILESEYVLLMHYLGRTDEAKVGKAAAYLRKKQMPEGGWSQYPGGPPDVSASVKAYFVLKLLGDEPEAPHMERARRAILELGGIESTNSFTKLYLSIFGVFEWEKAPAVPPELLFFPKWFPFNLYEMSSWSRAIVVPLSVIWALRPQCEVPDHALLDELHATGAPRKARPAVGGERGRAWASFFLLVDWMFKAFERVGLRPLRRAALRRAERWILERLEKSDGLGAIFPPIVNTILALDCLGYSREDPIFKRQVAELEKLEIEEEDTLRVQPCLSPVWDTSLVLNALAESDFPGDHPACERATEWLLSKEVVEPGDWRVKNPQGPIGGWYFEYANEFYPDCDDTAEVLTALARVRLTGRVGRRSREAADRGLAWLLAMQNRDGGWASFDRDCDRQFLTYIPFADHNAMIDPSSADITGRVLEALSLYGFGRSSPEVRRAVDYLLAAQEPDGSWFGRWGCNYIYGTWLALQGLAAIGEDPASEWGWRAVEWLEGCQNSDGGWGELPASYDDPNSKGKGPSTAAQTAWAVLGLIAAGREGSDAVRRGAEHLVATQREDGSWRDVHWTGTGFPKVFYLRYHYYAVYFPLLALGTYARLAERRLRPEQGPRLVS